LVQGFPRRRRRRPRSPERAAGERGFVLIAAIWLLILAGSITAILMLRSVAAATAAADQSDSVAGRLALESAIETVIADRLFNGTRSRWWLAPSEAAVPIGARQVRVRLTSESGRIDVNLADPALIDAALRGLGVRSAERGRIVARLRALRAMKRRIGSLAELGSLVAGAGAAAGTCLPDHLTYVSGLAEPRPDQMSRRLARALGRPGGASMPAGLESGAALRVEAMEAATAPIVAIVRISGAADRPVQISAWGAPSPCSGAAWGR
jgi:general secretion pathway protein K